MAYLLWNHLKGWSFLTVSTAENLLWPVEAVEKKAVCVPDKKKQRCGKMKQEEVTAAKVTQTATDRLYGL